MIRIIDFKKIDLTDDEWRQYESICASYNRPNFKGSELFRSLFETDENGTIVVLKAPTHYTSMEVFMFMMSIMQHQHLRIMYSTLDSAVKDTQVVMQECRKVTEEARQLIAELKTSRD